MESIKKFKKIGNVPIFTCSDNYNISKVNYSDGEAEDVLLDLFKNNLGVEKRESLLKSSWPYFYHLSEHRGNVINWYEFKAGSKVLEIGAGCGAITESLVSKKVNVTALELTEKRCLINAHRNKKSKNLKVVIGNLQDFAKQTTEVYDYIVCVGVLEYSGTYIEGNMPYIKFLSLLRTLLTPNGRLILAIENRIGLKYWTGAKEDHDNNGLFDGINKYPNSKGIETFGKLELTRLLLDAGFKNSNFFYPFPDYKFPRLIYSDRFYPGDGVCEFPLSQLPTPTFDRDRIELFSEALAMLSVEKNNLFREFSNSFIVETYQETNTKIQPLFSVFSSSRKDKYNLTTKIIEKEGKLYAEKYSSQYSKKHLQGIHEFSKQMTTNHDFDTGKFVLPINIKNHSSYYSISFPFIYGKDLERLIFESIIDNEEGVAFGLIDKYIKLMYKLSDSKEPTPKNIADFKLLFGKDYPSNHKNYINPGNIDLNFDNIILDDKENLIIFDYEWVFDFPLPTDLVISRAFWWFFGPRYGKTLSWHGNKLALVGIGELITVPENIYTRYRNYFKNMSFVVDIEEKLQNYVSKSSSSFPSSWKKTNITKRSTRVGHISTQEERLNEILIELDQKTQLYHMLEHKSIELEREVFTIKSSRGYRVLEKVRSIKKMIS